MVKKKTEKLIQEKFLKLLESKSIDEIDINMICKNLKIKRQTFYYHYKNIYDVILSFYFDDSIEYKSVKYEDIVQETVNYLFKNEEFNREVSHSNAKDILNEFIYSNLYKTMILYLKKYTFYVIFIFKKICILNLYCFSRPLLVRKSVLQFYHAFFYFFIHNGTSVSTNYYLSFSYSYNYTTKKRI